MSEVDLRAFGLGFRGEVEFGADTWLRHRVHQPCSRAFLQRDPLPPVPGSAHWRIHALTSDGPTRTVHFAIARRLDWRAGRFKTGPLGRPLYPTLATEITDDADPDDTGYYLVLVAGAWFALGFACMFAILPIALPLWYLAGDAAGRIAGFTLIAGCAFCYAGGVYALSRKYCFIPLARRRLSTDGPASERYARALRRTYPRNTSLIGQAAVAIATLVVGLGLL